MVEVFPFDEDPYSGFVEGAVIDFLIRSRIIGQHLTSNGGNKGKVGGTQTKTKNIRTFTKNIS